MKKSPQGIVRRTRGRGALQGSDSLSYADVLNGWVGDDTLSSVQYEAANDGVFERRRKA